MSDNGKVIVIDGLTNQVTERDMTEDEIEARETLANEFTQVEAEKEAARTSALAKLAALGLTEEEIAAL